jgi:serine/threonine protein phosphatase 1
LIYAIGDIHGQVTMLHNLLLQLYPCLRDEDQLLFLGDYIDRGEDSRGVIELLLELRHHRPNTIFLRGNHEQMMLDAWEDNPPHQSDTGGICFSERTALWLQNGGRETLQSYRQLIEDPLRWWKVIPNSHWEFLLATEMEYVTPRYHFVHAGLLPPGETWEGEAYGLDPRLWIRNEFINSDYNFEGRIVVFGHTPQIGYDETEQLVAGPLVHPNKIGLDTGAFIGGPLTAAAFDPDAPGRYPPAPYFYFAEHSKRKIHRFAAEEA